jgi:predicted GH43/DUF377 family glycosyl hydrolase
MEGLIELNRLALVVSPEQGNLFEVEGILNPAATRGPDGHLYVFPRVVAKGNYSRIGIARVLFDQAGDPCQIERLGIALEPETDYERSSEIKGGCEDPRIAFIEPLGHYVMGYTALSPRGPRIALAVSEDLLKWERLGLATFEPYEDIEFDEVDNKDAAVFPISVPDPFGKPSLAILHRPLFPGTRPEEKAKLPDESNRELESIWISYRDMFADREDPQELCHFTSHHRLAAPAELWESLKVGCGPPPILTRHGWLMIYHGVGPSETRRKLVYSAGVMLLAKEDPRKILYRSPEPILSPVTPAELEGTVADVVFPTGIDRRDDLGDKDRFDIYYGMADERFGVARLDIPATRPGSVAVQSPKDVNEFQPI